MERTIQWPRDQIGREMVLSTTCFRSPLMERKVTKFSYYNNYSLTQPRYFCKTCRRYWTEAGSLRNVPVGGGSRKNKRSFSSSSTSPKKTLSENLSPPTTTSESPTSENHNIHEGQDLNLAFQTAQEYHNLSHEIVEQLTLSIVVRLLVLTTMKLHLLIPQLVLLPPPPLYQPLSC